MERETGRVVSDRFQAAVILPLDSLVVDVFPPSTRDCWELQGCQVKT